MTTPVAVEGPLFVTMMVKLMLLEINVGPPDAVLEMDKSATGLTTATADAALLLVMTSGSNETTFAVFVIELAMTGLTVMVTVAVALLARSPRSHETTPFVTVQGPWVDWAETKFAPGGSGSVSVMPVVADGP